MSKASDPGTCPLHLWFELSYASWLTLPRVLMQEMPWEWRVRMAELLREFDEEFPNKLDMDTRVQFQKHGRLCAGPRWLVEYRRPNQGEIQKMRGVKMTPKNTKAPGRRYFDAEGSRMTSAVLPGGLRHCRSLFPKQEARQPGGWSSRIVPHVQRGSHGYIRKTAIHR